MGKALLHINSFGQGQDLVLLHGWGVNSEVFAPLLPSLAEYRVHLVDLPGFGDSPELNDDIESWITALAQQLPKQAIWLGWSLGGLIASLVAIHHPQSVKALVTIASSPCFMAKEQVGQAPWPGMSAKVLQQFAKQLNNNLAKTVEQFLAIQAMGSPHAKADIKTLKQLVLSKPLPSEATLALGLHFLEQLDIRQQLPQIKQPWLRIWGRLDSLVPKTVMNNMPQQANMQDIMLTKASHAPFISHQQAFLEELQPWLKQQAL
ncbi:pimeloyl-ACP methyl ester esterase BioH [Shewanella maritima]|uniref:pimeloyl-ACP methyl ester esterase BioH n=1 Tax=Shewanella maritima TaxID=2520507 RepID=UPI003735BADA